MSEDRFLNVAAAILDGTPVEWDAVDNPASQDDRRVLERLRVVAHIADAHRHVLAEVPASWGHFAIVERIGSGTFGDVYRAADTALDRDVALKLLRSPAAGRHQREGRMLARVRHPNVVTVHGAAEHDGVYGIWMEFVKGRTLADLVAEHGPFSAADVMAIGVDVCRALAAVHASGLLHGDIKAQNVMREEGGRLVLMDFGTGRIAADETMSGGLAGTPLYIAPEVLNGEPAGASSDVYSLGVLLYFLLTGAFPVSGHTLGEVRRAHAAGFRIGLRARRPELPRRLAAIVERAIAPKGARFQTAAALESALARAAAPAIRRHWPPAAAVLATIAAGVAWSFRPPPIRPDELRLRVTEAAVTAIDRAGSVRWQHDFDAGVRYLGMEMSPPWRFMAGPNPSFLVGFSQLVRIANDASLAGIVIQFDAATGAPRRTFSFDDKVVIDGVTYGAPWVITSLAFDDRSGRIAVSSHHSQWDASLVTILDSSFHRQSTYVQAGWIEWLYWSAPDRLVVAGFNNAHDGGTVALLDPSRVDAQAPEPPGTHYFCSTCGRGTPIRVVVMPRTEVNRASAARFNRAVLQVLDDRLVARTIEVPATGSNPAIDALYDFTPSLELIHTALPPGYWQRHDALFAEGKLDHRRDDCPEKDGPREVLVWDEKDPEWKRVAVRPHVGRAARSTE